MNVRPRYFIKTKDNLFFAVNTYYHPENAIISFLRYVPDSNGDRLLNNIRYKKVNSSEAYSYIKKNHPNYLFTWNVENKKMMGVPVCDIEAVYNPITRLNEILHDNSPSEFYDKIRKLAHVFHNGAGISYDDMGITGSTLVNLEQSNSDIDFIIFGLDNHKKARQLYGKLKTDESSSLCKIEGDFWNRLYKKRIKDDSLSFDEFVWYESRKNNRGIIDDTLFDILSTMNPDDLDKNEERSYKQLGHMKIKCKIIDDKQSFDTPSIYRISDVQVLEGVNKNIEKLISFTHTYAGSVKNNETVVASGVCEEVSYKDSDKKTYNLIIGSTRESINEYIKLEKNPIKKIVKRN